MSFARPNQDRELEYNIFLGSGLTLSKFQKVYIWFFKWLVYILSINYMLPYFIVHRGFFVQDICQNQIPSSSSKFRNFLF
jgi:hypothetical protein